MMMYMQHRDEALLASYTLFSGELPPTLIASMWHGGFSARRNPFALCYYGRRYSSLGVRSEERRVGKECAD